ncbi:MAG TPA: ribonuclease PH [Candidatus Latescibacteria bacterium]|nr:ribonuclease PH [Candidatus Latescibacterota bacterium]
MREVRIKRDYLTHAEGSALIEQGNTKVICSVSIEEKVPSFLRGGGTGWLTAEYGMLPRSAQKRIPRELTVGTVKGRIYEIQRMIGRSLRAIIDLGQIGERTIQIDCDVIEADGGTRTASITGAWVALYDALSKMRKERIIQSDPLLDQLAAISVGVINNTPVLDLCYEEDSKAQVDMNIVMVPSGDIVEIQGTAEEKPFSQTLMMEMLRLAKDGISQLAVIQRKALGLE